MLSWLPPIHINGKLENYVLRYSPPDGCLMNQGSVSPLSLREVRHVISLQWLNTTVTSAPSDEFQAILSFKLICYNLTRQTKSLLFELFHVSRKVFVTLSLDWTKRFLSKT